MKRYHVTTFGCQMNEHDSERMKGMLESLGYASADERADAMAVGQEGEGGEAGRGCADGRQPPDDQVIRPAGVAE